MLHYQGAVKSWQPQSRVLEHRLDDADSMASRDLLLAASHLREIRYATEEQLASPPEQFAAVEKVRKSKAREGSTAEPTWVAVTSRTARTAGPSDDGIVPAGR